MMLACIEITQNKSLTIALGIYSYIKKRLGRAKQLGDFFLIQRHKKSITLAIKS